MDKKGLQSWVIVFIAAIVFILIINILTTVIFNNSKNYAEVKTQEILSLYERDVGRLNSVSNFFGVIFLLEWFGIIDNECDHFYFDECKLECDEEDLRCIERCEEIKKECSER